MIIVLKPDIREDELQHISDKVREWGFEAHISKGKDQTVVGIIGDEAEVRSRPLEALPGVDSVAAVGRPYKLASAAFHPERSELPVPGVERGDPPVVFGGERVVVMAGPCSVESAAMLEDVGREVQEHGAMILRGGVFKPRSSPYAFQGLGVDGLSYLAAARRRLKMPVITEVMDTRDVDMVAEFADILQVGARNMQNFNLLKVIGKCGKPVMIKRGLSNTLEELLMSAEYVMSKGNAQVILCERGIRTFETFTRNTLDLSAVPVLQRESHLPVVVDPSHGTGHWYLVAPMARAAVAAGADGVMLEVHPRPEEALSDGPQAMVPEKFIETMNALRTVAQAVGRSL